jgi:hypothetical protein
VDTSQYPVLAGLFVGYSWHIAVHKFCILQDDQDMAIHPAEVLEVQEEGRAVRGYIVVVQDEAGPDKVEGLAMVVHPIA